MNQTEAAMDREFRLRQYYRYHARFYDQSRWSFLFGRNRLIQELPELPPYPRILEVGCGTGKNIEHLEYYYPDAQIYGVDLSAAMLAEARKKLDTRQVTLINKAYGDPDLFREPFDTIIFSYSLSMVGEDIEAVLRQVQEDLKPNGYIAVVDFHYTPFRWFRVWMKRNHVTMEGQLPSLLYKYFADQQYRMDNAYFGLWKYFHFLGRRT